MRISGELKIIVGAALFALIPSCVVFGKDLSVYGLLFGRLLLASMILFVLSKNKKKYFQVSPKEVIRLFGWSQLMLGAMVCYFLAINLSSISVASALLGTQPVIIVVLAAFLMKERITTTSLVAALLTLIGIFCVTGLNDVADPDYAMGELLAILSAFFLSLNFILQKKYLGRFSGQDLVFYSGVMQLPLLFPLVLLFPGELTVNSTLAIVVLAVGCTVLAYSLIYNGIKQVSAQKIGVLQSIEYVLPIFFGILFFNEFPTPQVIVGILLIIGACFLIGFGPKKEKGK